MSDIEVKFDDFATKIKDDLLTCLDNNLKCLKSDIDCIVLKLNKLEKHTNVLETRVEVIEKNNRLCDLVVTGIPILPDENIANIVNKIGDVINFNMQNCICRVFRLYKGNSSKQNRAPPIIIKFPFLLFAQEFYDKYKLKKNLSLNDIGLNGVNSRIYINVGLTPQNNYIMHEAKKLQKTGVIYKAFVKSGYVYGVYSSSSQPVLLRCLKDIDSLIGNKMRGITTLTDKNSHAPNVVVKSTNECLLEPRMTRSASKSS